MGVGVVDKSLLQGCVVFSYDLVFLAVFGFRLLAVGCRVLVFFCRMNLSVVVVNCWLLGVGCRVPTVDCRVSLSVVVVCPFMVVGCGLVVFLSVSTVAYYFHGQCPALIWEASM
jgi:hypothetical protein